MPAALAALSLPLAWTAEAAQWIVEGRRNLSYESTASYPEPEYPGSEGEPVVVIDPTQPDTLYAIAIDAALIDVGGELVGDPRIFVSRSGDGGRSWQALGAQTAAIDAIFSPPLLPPGDSNVDPTAAFDDAGNLYVAFLSSNADRVLVGCKASGQGSFGLVAALGEGFADPRLDYPHLAVGRCGPTLSDACVWVVYSDGDHTTVASHAQLPTGSSRACLDGASAAFQHTRLEESPLTTLRYPTIAVGPRGETLVVMDRSGNQIIGWLDRDGIEGGFGFGDPFVIEPKLNLVEGRICILPGLRVGSDKDVEFDRSGRPGTWAYVAYMRNFFTYTDNASPCGIVGRYVSALSRIKIRYIDLSQSSPDEPAGWAVVEPAPVLAGHSYQFMPTLGSESESGRVAVVWYDTRGDAGAGGPDTDGKPNTDFGIFASVGALDGGALEFPPDPLEITPTEPSLPSRGRSNVARIWEDPTGKLFFDYIGLAFERGSFHAVWTDNSGAAGDNGVDGGENTDVYAARVAFDRDGDAKPDYRDNCSAAPEGIATFCDGDDADLDGYGNQCDADFDNDFGVSLTDFGVFRTRYGQPGMTDLDCDGTTNLIDFARFKARFGAPPGPSGLGCAGAGGCAEQPAWEP